MELDRIQSRRLELKGKILKARIFFISMVALTVLNCVLTAFGSKFPFPFFLMMNDLAFIQVLNTLADLTRFGLTVTMGILFSVLMIVAITAFFKAKNNYFYTLVMEWYLAADTAVLFLVGVWYFMLGSELSVVFTMILNLIFHIWLLVVLRSGRKSSYALTVLPEKEEEEGNPFAEFNPDDTGEDE